MCVEVRSKVQLVTNNCSTSSFGAKKCAGHVCGRVSGVSDRSIDRFLRSSCCIGIYYVKTCNFLYVLFPSKQHNPLYF